MTLSGGLSAGAAGGQERKGDNLGEGGVAAGLQLSAVGDCGLSHWTIGGRVWLEAVDAQSPSATRWFLSGPGSPWTVAVVGDGEESESRLLVGVSSFEGLGLSPFRSFQLGFPQQCSGTSGP